MHNNGLAEQTVSTRIHVLTAFSARCDITNPYEVKETLANLNAWSKSTKKKFVTTYSMFLKTINKTWQAPKYKPEQKIPFIPTETEIDQLIAACPPRTATLLQTLKETVARIGEAVNLKWIDLNTESKTLTITPEKGNNPRILKISDKLLDTLNRTKRKNEYIFSRMINHIRTLFCDQRKRLAEKLNSPRISKISFHTFRHWKGTTEYHTTKDIIHVQKTLGHKCIEDTMIYITIEESLFTADTDEWTTRVSHSLDEETKLIEANFT